MTAIAVNLIHRILLVAGTAAMVSTAVVFGATASVEKSPTTAPITLVTLTSALSPNGLHSGFCPFGKAHKHGEGCRGGSLTKGKARKCIYNGAVGAIVGGGTAAASTEGIGTAQGAIIGAASGCATSVID